MNTDAWDSQQERLVQLLQRRLASRATCAEVIDDHEEMLCSIWDFSARLLGPAGARAAMARAVQVAAPQEPLVLRVLVRQNGVDLRALQEYVAETSCGPAEMMQALLHLDVMIFRTLFDLAGETMVDPILRQIEGDTRRIT